MPAGVDQPKPNFIVEPDNWAAVMFFLSLATQWQIGAMGEVLGLNYPAVEAVMRIQRIKDRATLFADLQVMEQAAMAAFNEQRQKK